MFEIVPATEALALDLADHLSPASLLDTTVLGRTPRQSVVYNLRHSVYAFAGVDAGRCFCLFGIVPDSLTALSGQPWLLTAADMPPCRTTMARATRQYLPYVRQRFTRVHGFVYEHNAVSIRWLKWLGYTLAPEPTRLGSTEHRYYAFEWNADHG